MFTSHVSGVFTCVELLPQHIYSLTLHELMFKSPSLAKTTNALHKGPCGNRPRGRCNVPFFLGSFQFYVLK